MPDVEKPAAPRPSLRFYLGVGVFALAWHYIKARAFAFFNRYAPSRSVSPFRYRCGLVVFPLPIAFSYCIFYTRELIPGYDENRIALNVAADLVFISSFFVLDGDFWDKFRALFVYHATAHFPINAAAPQAGPD